jgi:telomere length regulation protein
MDNFYDVRVNSMICLLVHYPRQCAAYLTGEFYEAGYSLSQRVDILHVLTMSVQKLSSPNEEPVFDKRIVQNQQNANVSTLIAYNHRFGPSKQPEGELSWQEIVQKRIDAKTKIKTAARSNKQAGNKENKFSDVYGYFFFPLLNPFDK